MYLNLAEAYLGAAFGVFNEKPPSGFETTEGAGGG